MTGSPASRTARFTTAIPSTSWSASGCGRAGCGSWPRVGNGALIRGEIKPKDRILVSRFAEVGDGVRVRVP